MKLFNILKIQWPDKYYQRCGELMVIFYLRAGKIAPHFLSHRTCLQHVVEAKKTAATRTTVFTKTIMPFLF
jgi:hypothetical protein